MSDTEQAETTAVEQATGVSIPGEGSQQTNARDEPAEIESRARAQGWVPKEEFRGPAENWRDANEFVRRGEEELPILRERSRTLSKTVEELQRRDAERKSEIERIERVSNIALQRQKEQLEANYRAAMRQAVESGDVARFDQLDQDRAKAITSFDEQVAPPKQGSQPQYPAHDVAAVNSWTRQNPWFNADPELNAVAQARHVQLQSEKPGLSLNENLAEVAKYVRQRYSDKFSPTQSGAVEGGGARLASASKTKGASSLSSDERRIGERFVKEGLFKDLNEYARDLYADA